MVTSATLGGGRTSSSSATPVPRLAASRRILHPRPPPRPHPARRRLRGWLSLVELRLPPLRPRRH
eukprot:946335-Pleurochrysis_carterae.AAC.3